MNNKESSAVADGSDHDQYTSCQARERALNAAILRADITKNFEQYLDIFDAFYADDVEVSSENHERPIQGKAEVRSLLIEVPMWSETLRGTECTSVTFFISRNLIRWMH